VTAAARLQLLGAARVGVGAAWALGLLSGARAAGGTLPRTGRTAAGALAVRDLAQGAMLLRAPEPASVEAGAAIDVLHALSMLPVVAVSSRYRRAAAVSALVATGWVGLAAYVTSGRPVVAKSGPRP
jgi:hypothetical protein